MDRVIDWAERGLFPDSLIRWGIRRKLDPWTRPIDIEKVSLDKQKMVKSLRTSPIALSTDEANAQHYELPAAFFGKFLGPHRKYSSCYWPAGVKTLAEAEGAMLDLTCQRAELADGQSILELGCGWGSLTLWMAERFPNSSILAVSNSNSQREYILAEAKRRGRSNVSVVTQDLNHFQAERTFDRIVSVECFEHLRNYGEIFARMARWLTPSGRCFLHIFCHRQFVYPFEGGSQDWMGEYFFQSGLMPSADLFYHFNDDLRVLESWAVNGKHYERTLNAWLIEFDRHRSEIETILMSVYPPSDRSRWMQRWRMFFMACAELFGYANGNEWFVSHYLLGPTRS
jgi:cyclopropane-fatty-acyl-phospholipid synthase